MKTSVRVLRGTVFAGLAVSLAAPASALAAPSASPSWAETAAVLAPAAAEVLQLPFPCGETWRGNGDASSRHVGTEIDFNWGSGSQDLGRRVVAAAGGTVQFAGDKGNGYGNYVQLVHLDGTYTLYAHLQRLAVHTGAEIARGEQIGTVGGTSSRGMIDVHLHFEHKTSPKQSGFLPVSFDGRPFPYGMGDVQIKSNNCEAPVTPVVDNGLSVETFGRDRVMVYARSVDSSVAHQQYTPSTGKFSGTWQRLEGSTAGSTPEAAAWPDGTLQIFAAGSTPTAMTRRIRSSTGSYLPEQTLGTDTPVAFHPEVAAPAQDQLRVFYVDTAGVLHNKGYKNGNWGPWGSLGGGFTSAPETVLHSGQLTVFVAKGPTTVLKKTLDLAAGTWTGWSSLTTPAMAPGSGPGAAARPDGQIVLAVRGQDNHLHSTVRRTNGTWDPFRDLAGTGATDVGSSPEIAAPDETTLLILARTTKGTPAYTRWTSTTSWNRWTPIP